VLPHEYIFLCRENIVLSCTTASETEIWAGAPASNWDRAQKSSVRRARIMRLVFCFVSVQSQTYYPN